MPFESATLTSFPRAILHMDGDAFFASCEQALNPALKGKPVVTGKERGIAASMSYEAKARGVTRAMPLHEVKKVCPDAIIIPSDYETYSLLSNRFFDIVRRYTSDVEEYGIDECFADITGMRRPFYMSYSRIAHAIQEDLIRELNFTFSIGLAPTKVLAKIASNWKKPAGLTVIFRRTAPHFLNTLPVQRIWGIGPQTTAYLNKYGIRTAFDFARKPEDWVQSHLTKPGYEIWEELNGQSVLSIDPQEKKSYQSIQKFKTFTPPSRDRRFIFSQMSKNIENACIKLRQYHQATQEVVFALRTQSFENFGLQVRLSRPTAFPHEIIAACAHVFDELFNPTLLYRQTGIMLARLSSDSLGQLDLFGESLKFEKLQRLYTHLDDLAVHYGKHTVYLGSSFEANAFAQHLGERGDVPRRKTDLFKGETKRKRINIPMLTSPVI